MPSPSNLTILKVLNDFCYATELLAICCGQVARCRADDIVAAWRSVCSVQRIDKNSLYRSNGIKICRIIETAPHAPVVRGLTQLYESPV